MAPFVKSPSYWAKPVPGIPGPRVFEPPTIDEDDRSLEFRASEAPVPDWTEGQTMVVRKKHADFPNAAQAMAWFKEQHGRVLQNLSDARWYAARVYRPKGP